MSSWTLFLDDERHSALIDDTLIVCRNSAEALAEMQRRGCPRAMYLDHDLGHEDDATKVFYPGFEALVLDQVISIPEDFRVEIHSQNPVGGRYLAGKIESLVREMRRRAAMPNEITPG